MRRVRSRDPGDAVGVEPPDQNGTSRQWQAQPIVGEGQVKR